MIAACSWCRHETRNGRRVGFPLNGSAYNNASHGMCVECADAYEASCLNADLARSERVRSENTQTRPIVAAAAPRPGRE